tara:strand:- start:6418 stop:7008 length:591 start_codon:yes stop_codon:yes gene_type:complete
MKINLSEEFWDQKYKNNKTGWDLGEISPPLKEYFDQLINKDQKILIPGGGNSYEAEYLHHLGFINVFVVDLSKAPLENIQKRVPTFPSEHLVQKDFFDLEMKFDLIIEQTFFCAIDPKLRQEYVIKAHQLLEDSGKIVGLLFDAPLNTEHPPFGGSKEEYIVYFTPYFEISLLEKSYNSVENRLGRELFFKVKKLN